MVRDRHFKMESAAAPAVPTAAPATAESIKHEHDTHRLRLGHMQDALDLLHHEVLIPYMHFVEVLRSTSRRGVTVQSIARAAEELVEKGDD